MSGDRHNLVIAVQAEAAPDGSALSLRDVRGLRPWLRPFGFDSVEVWASDRRAFPRPFVTLSCARYLARRRCELRLPDGASEPVSWLAPLCLGTAWLRDRLGRDGLLRAAESVAASLGVPPAVPTLARSGAAVYLRTDPAPLARFGGNHTHMTGVLGALGRIWSGTVLLTTLPAPQISDAVLVRRVDPVRRFWDHPECGRLANGLAEPARLAAALGGTEVGFIYQRNTAFDLCGVRLARYLNVPVVLEYNGPEAWMARHWAGRALEFEALAEKIETANLKAAHLVVVVSEASRAEVAGRGIDPARIAVIANGVDLAAFHPAVSGDAVREGLGIGDAPVIGFAGSFGPWHGVHILAEAFIALRRRVGGKPGAPRLLLIGDGPGLAPVLDRLQAAGLADSVHAVGAVPPAAMPGYLAISHMVVMPHVPNPDGNRFFGSPTKLFEYLAMGKPVVASDLEQIGDVIRHSGGGLLAPPGDVPALAAALERLCGDAPLRGQLGAAGAAWAKVNAGWDRRVNDMLSALASSCART